MKKEKLIKFLEEVGFRKTSERQYTLFFDDLRKYFIDFIFTQNLAEEDCIYITVGYIKRSEVGIQHAFLPAVVFNECTVQGGLFYEIRLLKASDYQLWKFVGKDKDYIAPDYTEMKITKTYQRIL